MAEAALPVAVGSLLTEAWPPAAVPGPRMRVDAGARGGYELTLGPVYRRLQRRFVRTEDSLSSIAMPDPNDAVAWEAYIQRTRTAAEERIHAEVDRLRRANIIDRDGRVIPETMPPDMDPTSETSAVTEL